MGLTVTEGAVCKMCGEERWKENSCCNTLLICMREIVALEGVYHVMSNKLCISFR